MIDLVTANEFTFTPSAFIAAYIEQDTVTTITETTGNGGTLTTQPLSIGNLDGTFTAPKVTSEFIGNNSNVQFLSSPAIHTGLSAAGGGIPEGALAITGTIGELLGLDVTDTRTTTKVTQTLTGVANTVVLVLSYGQYRAKCANAQATVSAIHSAVAAYFNSL